MKTVIDTTYCTGCEACVQKCPQHCIAMMMNRKGFRYPVIEQSRCTKCNLCRKVCPCGKPIDKTNSEITLFAGIHKDANLWMNSSSGGAFSAIANAFCDNNYILYGAAYRDNLKVEHTCIDNLKDLFVLRKSKYVQSQINQSFTEIELLLKSGKKVLFSGVPCQVAGLKAYLGKEYEQLLCIDLICTGVGSPLVFRRSLDLLEKSKGKKIISCDMRSKIIKDVKWHLMNTKITYEDETEQSDQLTNRYNSCYGQRVCLREACYHCPYATLPRVGDITIADWWGGVSMFETIEEDRGVSFIIFNKRNPETASLVHNIMLDDILASIKESMYLKEVNLKDALSQNPTLSHPTPRPDRTDRFWTDFRKKPFEAVLNQYSKPIFKTRLLILISHLLPCKVRKLIRKLIYRLLKYLRA